MTNLKSGMSARWRRAVCGSALAAALSRLGRACAGRGIRGLLDGIHRHTTLTSTETDTWGSKSVRHCRRSGHRRHDFKRTTC